MTVNDWIGLAGILIAVVVSIPGYFVVKNRYATKQTQKVGHGGVGIQAGRDVDADIKR